MADELLRETFAYQHVRESTLAFYFIAVVSEAPYVFLVFGFGSSDSSPLPVSATTLVPFLERAGWVRVALPLGESGASSVLRV